MARGAFFFFGGLLGMGAVRAKGMDTRRVRAMVRKCMFDLLLWREGFVGDGAVCGGR